MLGACGLSHALKPQRAVSTRRRGKGLQSMLAEVKSAYREEEARPTQDYLAVRVGAGARVHREDTGGHGAAAHPRVQPESSGLYCSTPSELPLSVK